MLARMAAAMLRAPTFRQLDSSSHLRHWQNEQAKVVAFAGGLHARLGRGSLVLWLHRDVVRKIGRGVFAWEGRFCVDLA